MVSFIEQPATQSLQKSNSAPSHPAGDAAHPADRAVRMTTSLMEGPTRFTLAIEEVGLQCPLVVPYDPLP